MEKGNQYFKGIRMIGRLWWEHWLVVCWTSRWACVMQYRTSTPASLCVHLSQFYLNADETSCINWLVSFSFVSFVINISCLLLYSATKYDLVNLLSDLLFWTYLIFYGDHIKLCVYPRVQKWTQRWTTRNLPTMLHADI